MRLIDADYLKTWFGEKDLYAYDYIIGTIDDAPTVEPQTRCIAKIEINKEDLENLVEEKVLDIKKAMSNTSNALKPLDKAEERWIPCSEKRLPEEGERVLCTHLGGLNPNRQVIEHIYQNGKFVLGWDMDMNPSSSTFGQRYMGKVIAWMPLPKPYGGEQE